MKIRKLRLFLLTVVILIGVSFTGASLIGSSGTLSADATGFLAIKTSSNLNLNDGMLDEIWTSVDTYQDVSEFGNGGYVKFANNGTHLFSLLVSSQDMEWISIEFEPDPSVCMTKLNDGWSFYIDKSDEAVLAKDVNFIGGKIPDDDDVHDLSVESIFSGDLVMIEVVRLFNTEDTDGYDIVYANGSTYMTQFASSDDHFGVHNHYYLVITDKTSGDGFVPTGIPQVDILNQVKFLALGMTPVGLFGFIIIHFIRRVITSPIKHDYTRIASSSKKPPSIKERWNETFSSRGQS